MLFPDQRTVTVEEAYAGAHRRPHPDRPWIVLTMISSADGAVVVDGSSGALGNTTDQQVFRYMHRSADTVLVGAETVRRDVYRPLPDHQTLVVVSQSGDLGEHGADLLAATNTHVVAGDATRIARSLPGAVCALEGGPNLNGQMLAAGLVDEVCLTISPMLVAGHSDRLAQGPSGLVDVDTRCWRLAHVCCDDEGYLFVRYLR